MFDADAAAEGDARPRTRAQPCKQGVAAPRATKDLADRRAIEVAIERETQALPILRRVELKDREAEAGILIVDRPRETAESVRRRAKGRFHRVPADDVAPTRQSADAIAVANAGVDRGQPVARKKRAPRTVLRSATAVDDNRRDVGRPRHQLRRFDLPLLRGCVATG